MIELSIPQLGEENKNVKDLVFAILSKEQPLSLIELTNKIKKQYVLSITYQAVRKAVNLMHTRGLLKKSEKKYSINKEWVLKLKSFFDNLLTTYETKTAVKIFNNELAKEDYAVYTFNNLLDLDNFWGDIMYYWADHEKENKNYFSYCNYHWWLLINLGHETKLFDHFNKTGVKSKFVVPIDVPLNRWAAAIYKEMKVKTKITPQKIEEPLVDINILGDTVIQVKYPKKVIDKIKSFFEKYKSVQEMSLKEITNLAYEPCEIKFIIFKNQTIAKSLTESYERMMK